MKTTVAIILFLLLLVGIQCNLRPCNGSGEYYPYYSILDYSLGLNRRIDSNHSEPLDSPYQIKFNELNLILSGNLFHHASRNIQPPLTFGTSCFACDARESGDMGCKENMDSIVITSDAEFLPGVLPGTSLNDRFDVMYRVQNGGAKIALTDFTQYFPIQPPYLMTFSLKEKPGASKMKFYIYIHQSNGISWTKETPLLTIN